MNEMVGSGGGDHVDVERLLAYAHGESAAEEAAAVLRHGRACRDCGDQLAVMMALRAAPAVAVAPPKAAPWMTPGRLSALAAALVVALMLSVVLMSSLFRGAVDDPAAGVFPAEAVALGARLATSAPPDPAMFDFLFPEATLAVQQGPGAGFGMIVERRYVEAVRQLQPLHDAAPLRGEVAAVLGVARYLNGDNGTEVEALLRQGNALAADDLRHLSAWYLSNLYLRRGDLVQARSVLDELAEWPDAPGQRAAALLERLDEENQ